MLNERLAIALLKAEDLRDDEEFEVILKYEKKCSELIHTTIQSLHETEAFEIFKDEVYELAMELNDRPLLARFKKWKSGGDLDVKKAKAYPIMQLMGRYGYEVRMGSIRCPFHGEDRSPSLKLYLNTNTWHCFACNEGSDVIDFVMKRQKIDFVSAIKQLT